MSKRCRHFYEDPYMIPAFFLIAGVTIIVALIMMAIRDHNIYAIIALSSFGLVAISLLFNRRLTNNFLTITMLATFLAAVIMAFIALWQVSPNPAPTTNKEYLESVGIWHR